MESIYESIGKRTGGNIYIGVVGPVRTGKSTLIKRIMEQLGQQIRTNLRRGDIISRCSTTQYIMMLPKANYEDSCMVCKRIVRNYFRRYPRAETDIRFTVFPIQPDIKEVSQWGHTTAPV